MAEIVNLRQARKAKARQDRERLADENRARFGESKAARALRAVQEQQTAQRLTGHKRDKPEPGA